MASNYGGLRRARMKGESHQFKKTYSHGQAKPTNKNGNFLMAAKYPENVQIG